MFIKPAKPGARAAQKASTRARILEAARAELERSGFDDTGIRSVADAAGVAAGTVLLHFKDKRDLLHAALFDDLEQTWAKARALPATDLLVDDLVAIATAFFRYYAARPTLSRALLRESLFATPPWSERFTRQVGEVHAHVAGLVARASARGALSRKVDPAVTGAAFFSFYYFALLAWAQGGHEDPVRFFRVLLVQHLDGLAAPASPPPAAAAPARTARKKSPPPPRTTGGARTQPRRRKP